MTMLHSTSVQVHTAPPRVRRIGEADLRWALAEGWRDFLDKRGDILMLAMIYPVVGFAAAALSVNNRLLPLFFPMVAGLSILGPAVASGFYEIAKRREAGLDSSWRHFLDPLRGPSRGPLAVLTAGLALLFTAWILSAWLIYGATLGAQPYVGLGDFLRRLFTTADGWLMIVAGNLAGYLFAFVTLACSLVAFPMVIDKRVDAVTAVETSVRAAWDNPAMTARWGLRVAILLALGCLPAFIGLAVVLPVLGYATWRLYTRLVER